MSSKQNMTDRLQYEVGVGYGSLHLTFSSFRFSHLDDWNRMTSMVEQSPSSPHIVKGQLIQVYGSVAYCDGSRSGTLQSTVLSKTGQYF